MKTLNERLTDCIAEVSKVKNEKSLNEILDSIESLKYWAEENLSKASAWRQIKVRNITLTANGELKTFPTLRGCTWDKMADEVLYQNETDNEAVINIFNTRLARKIVMSALRKVKKMGIVDKYGDIVQGSTRDYWNSRQEANGTSSYYLDYSYLYKDNGESLDGCLADIIIYEIHKEMEKYDFCGSTMTVDYADGRRGCALEVEFESGVSPIKRFSK